MKKTTVFSIALGAALGLGGYYFMVGNPTVAYPQNPREWTQEMREDYPAEFAALAKKALKADLATIDERLRGLQEAAAVIAKRYDDAQQKFDFGQKLAVELVAAKKAGKFPVEIFDNKYEEDELQSQMKLVCGELKVHQRTIEAVKKASKKLEAQKRDLANYRVECQGQLDVLEVEEIVFVNRRVSFDGLNLLNECAEALQDVGERLAQADPVRSLEDIMKSAEAQAEETVRNDDLDLEAFLGSLSAASEEAEASVSGEAESDAENEANVSDEADADVSDEAEADAYEFGGLEELLNLAEEALAEEVPADEAPAEEVPAEEAPAEEAPAEEAPTDEAPAEEVPADEAPAEEVPADEAPAEEVPVDEAPAEEAPADEAPAEEAPAGEAPAEEVPTENADLGKKAVEFLETTLSESEAKAKGIEEPQF